jgi:predicted enzyme related to lactoylglutathione lyase
MGGELSFFEIGVDDPERGRTFYESLFGWTFEPGPTEGYTISTPNMRGGMHGGDEGASPYLFFGVEDIEAASDRVRELGGEVEMIPGDNTEESAARFGHFRLCRDDQGSRFGLHQQPAG